MFRGLVDFEGVYEIFALFVFGGNVDGVLGYFFVRYVGFDVFVDYDCLGFFLLHLEDGFGFG